MTHATKSRVAIASAAAGIAFAVSAAAFASMPVHQPRPQFRLTDAGRPDKTTVTLALAAGEASPDADAGESVTPTRAKQTRAARGLELKAAATATPAARPDPAPPRAAAAFPLKMAPNRRYFVDQRATPFLINGDSPQALLVKLSLSDMRLYMASRHAHGFNAIIVDVLAGAYIKGLDSGMTYDGIAPFTRGSDPGNYDLATPNPAYFERLDAVVAMAASNRLLIFLDPIETGGWLPALQANGAAKAFNFGAFLGARYRNSGNVAWQSGNDFQNWRNETYNNLVYQVMAGIKSRAPDQIQTVELDFPASFINQNKLLSPLSDLNSAYTYFETYDVVLKSYNSAPIRPTFLIEANYEAENDGRSFPGIAGEFILRAQEYWTMTSGGVGQFYGSKWDWGFAPDWQIGLDSPGVVQLQYWAQFFTGVQWWKLVPDQAHKVVIAGYGTYNAGNDNFYTADYSTTAWHTDGSLAVTYDIAGYPLTVDLKRFRGPVTARWYDPSDGTYKTVADSPFHNNGAHVFAPPGKNHHGQSDWVLLLTSP